MIRIHCGGCLLAWLLLFSGGQIAYAQADEADVLKKMNQDWLHAIINRDTATLSGILADDFVMITPYGTKINKNDNLETLLSRAVSVSSINLDSLNVQVLSGETGIVTAWTSFVIRDASSKETRGRNCYQDVYVKRKGRWFAINAHVTVISMQ
jgi:uncharacterized protein (TIGR02246 family)